VLVLIVLDNGGNRLEAKIVALLHHVLQIEILDRNVIWAELEVAAHRLEVGFLDRFAECIFVGRVAFGLFECAVDQTDCIVRLSAVDRWGQLVLGLIVGDVTLAARAQQAAKSPSHEPDVMPSIRKSRLAQTIGK
jgi:hypothetical protein